MPKKNKQIEIVDDNSQDGKNDNSNSNQDSKESNDTNQDSNDSNDSNNSNDSNDSNDSNQDKSNLDISNPEKVKGKSMISNESEGKDEDSYANYTDDTDSDDEIEKEANELQVTKEFQENVIKYVKLHDLITKKNEEIRELKKMKKPCEDYILKYLDKVKVNSVEVTDGKLRKNQSENKVPLSQDIIKDAIAKKVSDPKVIEEILKSIENRATKIQVNIKRTKNSGPRLKPKKGKKGKDDD